MLIKVYAPPYCNHALISREGFIEMNEGATLGDLLTKIEMPPVMRLFPITFVNYARAKNSKVLQNGDTVSILQALGGG